MGRRKKYPQIISVDMCDECGSDQIVCKQSRFHNGVRCRTKMCRVCGHRFYTREVSEMEWQMLHDKIKVLEEFGNG